MRKRLFLIGILTLVLCLVLVSCESISEESHKESHVHTWDEGSVTTEPTCTEEGVKTYACSGCDETKTEMIPVTHNEVIDDAVAPTCTETGLTEGSHCSICGTVLTAQVIVPTIEHDYVNRVCASCGEVLPYSVGLAFISNGDGTCYVDGVGSCDDTDIVIPATSPGGESVTRIGDYAFQGLSALTSLEIPDSIASISISAFNDCTSLQYNTYDNAIYLGNADNPYFALIEASNPSITSCAIHTSTKVIAEGAFMTCSLTSIKIPEGVTSIGLSTFFNCKSLKSVTLPKGFTDIGYMAFYGCTSLTSIDIPSSVTSVGKMAFVNCAALEEVWLPSGVTNIGESAFAFCTSLIRINIPYNATSIGKMAFYACTKLSSISYPGTVEEWKAISKGEKWAYGTNYFCIITCLDGRIAVAVSYR